jgi:integrase
MSALMREAGLTDSTRAKHLRVLGTCLQAAIVDGYAVRNPVRELPPGQKPRKRKKEAAYFENEELPQLFAAVEEGVYRVLFLVALKTGMRLGELLALRWGAVDLVGAVVRVRESFTDGELSTPQNHEARDVDLTGDVVELLGGWWGDLGRPGDETLVFPGETRAGYMNQQTILRRELYPAMKTAGVPRVGPTGEKRTFHSLRHTFAKRALESGRQINLALTPPGPLVPRRHERGVRALGAGGAEARGRAHGGRFRRLANQRSLSASTSIRADFSSLASGSFHAPCASSGM